jgi:hypothetical protein
MMPLLAHERPTDPRTLIKDATAFVMIKNVSVLPLTAANGMTRANILNDFTFSLIWALIASASASWQARRAMVVRVALAFNAPRPSTERIPANFLLFCFPWSWMEQLMMQWHRLFAPIVKFDNLGCVRLTDTFSILSTSESIHNINNYNSE